MKDREIELVDIKTKCHKNEEVSLIAHIYELRLTDPTPCFLVAALNNRELYAMPNLHGST